MRVAAIVGVVSILLAGCSGDDGESTTTTTADPVTTLEPAPIAAGSTEPTTASTEAAPGTTTATTTTSAAPGLPPYRIAFREEGEVGATVVVLLDPTTYTSLSDIDLQDIIRDVYDEFPVVATAHVVDSPDVVDLVLLDRELFETEQALLDEHYLARLEDGIRIVYLGPFEEYPIAILGS